MFAVLAGVAVAHGGRAASAGASDTPSAATVASTSTITSTTSPSASSASTTSTSTTGSASDTSVTTTTTTGAVVVPVDLQSLLARARQSSSGRETAIVDSNLTYNGKTEVHEAYTVALRTTPYQFSETSRLGSPPDDLRLTGGYVYVKERRIARLDGGRPWVQMTPRQWVQHYGYDVHDTVVAQLLPLAAIVGAATALAEVGPATINGQPVTEFTGDVNTRTLGAGVTPSALPGSTDSLDMFVDSNGAVVRYVLSSWLSLPQKTTTTVVSTTGPLQIAPPPRRDRVSARKLTRAERRLVFTFP